jgi:taurine dioxygenase
MPAFEIKPMPIGAEVVGLEPGSESDPDVAKDLYAAWLEHGVLVFRGVDSIPEHLAISRVFGELELHPLPAMRDPEEPYFMRLGDDSGPAYVYDGTDLRRGRIAWHRDTAYTQGICKGAMLRLRAVPEEGGQTLFADTAKAYDDLSQDVKDRIDGLEYKASFQAQFSDRTRPGALWKDARLATEEEYPGQDAQVESANAMREAMKEKLPPVVHPVVAKHPESGRTCLFLSPKDAECILGVSKEESDELLAFLIGHMTKDEYVYEHDWAVDDAVIWDNRRMLHAAAGYPTTLHRHAQRTTLAGPFNAGRLFDEEADREPAGVA